MAVENNDSRVGLLKAASALMIERGGVDISLSEIAQRSGLNSALVKYYFGNKNGLFFALAEDVLGNALAQMDKLFDISMAPLDRIKLHIQGIINVYFSYPYINRMLHVLLEDPKLSERVSESITGPLVRTQSRLLADAVRAGQIKPIDPMFFYFIVVGACDHLFFSWGKVKDVFGLGDISEEIRRGYSKAVLDLVFDGIQIEK